MVRVARKRRDGWCCDADEQVGLVINQLLGVGIDALGFAEHTPVLDLDVNAFDPAQLGEPLGERDCLALSFRVKLGPPGQHTDPAYRLPRLRAR